MAQESKNQKKSGGNKSRAGKSKTGKQTKKQETFQEEVPAFLRAEVLIILAFAAAVLLFLSNFHMCGVVGDFLRSIQLGVFGAVGYVFPILVFVGTSFYLSNSGNRKAQIKLAAVIAAALTICGLAQLMFGVQPEAGKSVLQYYHNSSLNGSGGGLIGGLLSGGLSAVVGTIGTYLIFVAVLIICGVCITEKSVVKAVKSGSGKAYQYAREDVERRMKEHQEERRRLREENVVRGVDFDATNITGFLSEREDSLEDLTEQLAEKDGGKGRRHKPFEEELLQEEALLRQEEAQLKERRVPADDVFTGSIDLPPEYQEPVPFEEDKPEEKKEPVLFVRSGGKSHGPLRADREMMTLAEMDVTERPEMDVMEEPEMDVTEQPEMEAMEQPEMDVILRPEFGKAERSKPDAAVLPEVGVMAQPEAGAMAQRGMAAEPQSPVLLPEESRTDVVNPLSEEAVGTEGGVPEVWSRDGAALSAAKMDPGSVQITAEPETIDMSMDTASDWYPEEKTEAGVNYDSVFVPEGPKRVVTATGKVIETETELLQKKIEKKRQEAAAEGSGAGAVHAQVEIKKQEIKKPYVFPPVSLLKRGNRAAGAFSDKEYKDTAIKLQQTLRNFGVGVTVTNISCGPTVTRYELHPEQGVKVSKIVGLADDIKLSLAAAEIRIEAPIPGKSAVGIEVPNKENSIVYLRDLLESDGFKNSKSRLTFAVGKDIGGQPVVADIAKMPHLLIAGATGSGKSVCINTLIMSIIYKADPEDVKLIMVDPKVVELSVYNGIPHLLIPVVTDPKKASGALNWAVAEMGDRYKKFAAYNVRDLKGYNDKIAALTDIPEEERPKKLPQIVIIVDELADLMMVVPGEVEDAICRLAQLARAAGIHLVIATQRPSVNVITGLIKANVPSRIAFSVSSGVDSRTIIDMNGAEKLLGKGDMLFYPSGFPKPQRVQGAFVSDQEVSSVVEFLTEQGMTAQYSSEVETRMAAGAAEMPGSGDSSRDEYFVQAGKFIIEKEKASIGMLQRAFKIGFNRAARIMDQLADAGVVGEEEGTKPRKILMTMEEFNQLLAGQGQ